MGGLKEPLKRVMPTGLWTPLSDLYWWWFNRGRHVAAGNLSAQRRASVQALRSYQGRHRGSRCFILGNGPSLGKMDLTPLKDEITFGLNRIYLLFPEIGFSTTYLVSVNTLVIEQCAEELKSLSIPKFISWRGRRWMGMDPGTIFTDTDYTLPETFSYDATGRIYEGCTVTYVALQLAFHMGIEQAILIGVDHYFATKGPPNAVVVSQGEDPDHFDSEYFGKGFRWQLPDLECAERAYALAREAYESHGRQVLDATVGGKLEVFPKVDYEELFK